MAPKEEPLNNPDLDFFYQLDNAPKFEDLSKESKSKIIGNPDNWDKLDTSKKTKKKKEKKVNVKPNLTKYFVEFKINVGGLRKECGLIIESASNKDLSTLAYQRMSKQFSNLRSLNCLKFKLYENEEEYINDLEQTSVKVETPKKTVETTEDNELLNLFNDTINSLPDEIKNKKCWRVIVTPGRRPRPRDKSKRGLITIKNSEEECIKFVKEQFAQDGITLKDKEIMTVETTIYNAIISERERFLNSDIAELNDFISYMKEAVMLLDLKNANDEDLKPKSFSENEKQKLAEETDKALEEIRNLEYKMSVNEDGFIEEIIPVPKTLIEQLNVNKFKEFLIRPIETAKSYPSTKVLSINMILALRTFLNMKDGVEKTLGKTTYKFITKVNVINVETNESYTAEVSKIDMSKLK